jgi:hypothetical protein
MNRLDEYGKCVDGMTYGQIVAVVQKHMENNPARWHYSMASEIWLALDDVCPAASK